VLALYHNDMSVCAQKVRLVLREKRLAPTLHFLDLRRGDQFAPAYLKLNPNGVVPTLVHDGRAIVESTVIIEYLDDAFPDPPVRPAALWARAAMRLWTKVPDEGLHAACATISNAVAFRWQYLALGEAELEANLRQTPDPARRERKRQGILQGMDWPAAHEAIRFHDKLLARMEAALAGSPWLAGEAYSLADAAITPYIVRLDHLQLSWMWRGQPRVADWYARIQARPNFAAIGDFLDPGYLSLMAEKGREAAVKARSALGGAAP
jgi:glutathione S-transferase